jgi:hypothetical protein
VVGSNLSFNGCNPEIGFQNFEFINTMYFQLLLPATFSLFEDLSNSRYFTDERIGAKIVLKPDGRPLLHKTIKPIVRKPS